jgi:hypothetical protein
VLSSAPGPSSLIQVGGRNSPLLVHFHISFHVGRCMTNICRTAPSEPRQGGESADSTTLWSWLDQGSAERPARGRLRGEEVPRVVDCWSTCGH